MKRNMTIKTFKRLLTNVIILILTVNIFLSCKQEDLKLATFDGGDVRLNEYMDLYLLSTLSKPDIFPDEENLKQLILRITMEKMYVREAKSQGLESDSNFKAGYSRILNNLIYGEYIKKEIAGPIVTDSLIQRFYDLYSPQYKMYHIQRSFSPDTGDAGVQLQKDTINYIYNELNTGKNFEELAKRFSQDEKTRSNGGDLGYFITESFRDPIKREAMENLFPFSYSKPIRIHDGFYILYMGEKRDVPVPPFENTEGWIRRFFYKAHEDDIENNLKRRMDSLKKKYNYVVNNQLVNDINEKVKEKASKGYVIYKYSRLSLEDKNSIVATYDGGGVKVRELFARGHRRPDNIYEFRERLEIIARFHLVGKHAVELGYDKLPKLQPKIKESFEKYLSAVLHKNNIKDVNEKKIDSLKTAFKMNKKSEKEKISLEDKIIKTRKETKDKFEKMLREKYNFRFVTENFPVAIAEAEKQKKIQIAEQSQRNE
jgi:parvulin-like peptidyl-prolyl isomerase